MVITENFEQVNAFLFCYRLITDQSKFLGVLKSVVSLHFRFYHYVCVIGSLLLIQEGHSMLDRPFFEFHKTTFFISSKLGLWVFCVQKTILTTSDPYQSMRLGERIHWDQPHCSIYILSEVRGKKRI